MKRALHEAVERARGAQIQDLSGASGGCIGESFTIGFSDGSRAFLKSYPSLAPDAVLREAEGLRWLAEAGARVPGVLAAGDGFLLLELIELAGGSRHDEEPRAGGGEGPKGRAAGAQEALGRELAALHRFGAPTFGLSTPNYLATLLQDNRPLDSWPDFYRQRRLQPLVARARQQGHCPASTTRRFDALYARLETLAGPAEAPARLHGDLWGGNRLVDQSGQSWLIDPAVYGGHREIDLAMMRLFGGFSRRTFDAYHEAFPLAPGHEQRVPLYQLYPLLAHLVMFGSSYLGQVDDALDALL